MKIGETDMSAVERGRLKISVILLRKRGNVEPIINNLISKLKIVTFCTHYVSLDK